MAITMERHKVRWGDMNQTGGKEIEGEGERKGGAKIECVVVSWTNN
jgi:hypothetical protein